MFETSPDPLEKNGVDVEEGLNTIIEGKFPREAEEIDPEALAREVEELESSLPDSEEGDPEELDFAA